MRKNPHYSTSVAIDKIAAHFSASHALISDGIEEGLHGHNYHVAIELEGKTDTNEIIIDFLYLEKLLNNLLSKWDHYVLLPSNNPNIKIGRHENNLDIEYGVRFYSIPKDEVRILECSNVTTEALAKILGEKIQDKLKLEKFWPRIEKINITIWETSCYRATCSIQPIGQEKYENLI
ncbi:MAG: 6-pyruvoyl tetrahydropterin synthase family protein [Candidatus Hodarchaeota archaeon]